MTGYGGIRSGKEPNFNCTKRRPRFLTLSKPIFLRTADDICLLCRTNAATQRKSHVIPKFFGDGIFYGTNPRHGIAISKETGLQKKIQDITKSDFLFCPACEKGISIFETYSILRIERYNQIRYFNEFRNHKLGEFQFFECLRIDIRVFNLFIYSIVWRLSVSDSFEFRKFKLLEEDEEMLRTIISRCVHSSQNDLIQNLDQVDNLPNHSHIIIRPVKKLRPPRFMMSAASLDQHTHQICLVDYLVVYLTDRRKLVQNLVQIDNNTIDRVPRVGLTTPVSWESFNLDLLRRWS